MDAKSVEVVLKKIIEIDLKTDDEVKKLQSEILEREKQLKRIVSEIEQNSILHQVEHGKKLYDRIMNEAILEKNSIQEDCVTKLSMMDQLFNENEAKMIERAFNKLSVDRWGT